MKEPNKQGIEENALIINVKGDSRQLNRLTMEGNTYAWAFSGGGSLKSPLVGEWYSAGAQLLHSVGDWLVVLEDGTELLLPKDKKWKILFEDGAKVVSLPYKTLIHGQWVLVNGVEEQEGVVLVYMGNSSYPDTYHSTFRRHFKFDISKKGIKKRSKNFKKRNRQEDDDDDEDNIMRALGSGGGDLVGF
jgi:hypothetical protein